MTNPLLELKKLGQSPWLDFISREFLKSGEIKRMIEEDGISGITSNPTIFEKAITSGTYYDEEIISLAKKGKSKEEIYNLITAKDVREACDLLRRVYEESKGMDGYVSIEIPPRYAYDTNATIKSAIELFNFIGRENLLIKVPATEEGIRALPQLIQEGINVNSTLIFSLSQYERTAHAYLEGLKERQRMGKTLASVFSVASIFVSRIDTAVDRILDKMGVKALRGKVALANCQLIYLAFKKIFFSPSFLEMERKGAKIQRIVWGSTSTKDPVYSDVKYVEGLIGNGTINTMPPATISAFKHHGIVKPTLEEGWEEGERVLEEIKGLGIDLEAISKQLLKEGIEAFSQSFNSTLIAIENKIAKLKQ